MSMNLYRRRKFLASAALLAALAIGLCAIAQQRRGAHKLRATALVEVTTDAMGVVKSRVIPITILDGGSFHDAGIYEARPRPMALGNGVVYEAQQSGKPVGYVTIVNGSRDEGTWIALGKWQLVTIAKKTETPPAASTDERPVLHRGDSAPSPTPSPTPEPPGATTPTPPQPEDPDRPVLRKRAPEKAEPEQPPSGQPSPAPEGAVPSATPAAVVAGTKVYVGVSDAESSEGRSYEYPWKPGEEQKMQEKMLKLALAQLPRENAQLTPGSFRNVVMRSFDLDMSNEAVLVLSAEIPGSYFAPGGKQAAGKFVSRYVTLIARTDFEGTPRKLAASVTDSTRLDVAPRLELVDAVDADGDGLAELLFREYSFDEKSFIIYGVGRSTVTKVFEGASVKLK